MRHIATILEHAYGIGRLEDGMMARVNSVAVVLLCGCMMAACSVESNVEQVWELEVNAKDKISPEMDKAVEADRNLPHVALVNSPIGVSGMRMLQIDPAGDIRKGRMVVMDMRTHSGDIPPALANMPGLETKTKIEVTSAQGGKDMIQSLSIHPVLLADVQFDCKAGTISYLAYHAADTFRGPIAYSFQTPGEPSAKKITEEMLQAACTSQPKGLSSPSAA